MLLAGATAWAQERQAFPLRYQLWWDEGSFWITGMLKKTEPGSAKVPPLPNAQFFAHKFVDGERLFMLVKEGEKFVLYADTDGDNDLTDERPFQLRQRGSAQVFGPIPMRFRVNGNTLLRHLGVRLFLRNDEISLDLLVSCCWRGTMIWRGKPTPVMVIDRNCNGAIDSSDTLWIGEEGQIEWLSATGQIGISGQFWRYRVAPTGEELVMEPISVPTATVRFQGEYLRLFVENESGKWMLEGQGGQMIAPIGEFLLMGVELSRKDERGRLWKLQADATGPAAPKITISPSGTNVDVEPLKVSVIYNPVERDLEFSLEIKTANGMSIGGLWVNEQLPPEPRLQLVANGRVIDEPQFHYG